MKKILIVFSSIVFFILVVFFLLGCFESKAEFILNNYQDRPSLFMLFSFLILATDVVLPIPSTIVMYLNGYVMGILPGFIISMASMMVSSIAGYLIGSRLTFTPKSVTSAGIYNKYGQMAILLTRGVPILAETVSIMSGYVKMPFKPFVLYHFIGYIPVCLTYVYLGKFAKDQNAFSLVFLTSIILTILFWIYGYFLSKKETRQVFDRN